MQRITKINAREVVSYSIAAIIPCWNCEQYVEGMIKCILNQSFSDWRAFFIDDGSTDSTARIIQVYSNIDKRIIYVKRERLPKGAPTCRNIGFELSVGATYVVFFDADDIIAPYCFDQRVKYMNQNPSCDFSIFKAKSFHNSIYDSDSLIYGVKYIDNTLQAMLNWNLPMVGWTNIYKRQSLIDYNVMWDEQLLSLQDSDYNIQSLVSGMLYTFADTSKVDYFYRITTDGISRKICSDAHRKSHIYLLNKTLRVLATNNEVTDIMLRTNILLYLNLFLRERLSCIDFFKIPWIKKRVLFYVRMLIYVVLRGRGRKYLFRKEMEYSNSLTSIWLHKNRKSVSYFLCYAQNEDNLLKIEAILANN